ncbi:MAG TPA: protein kinase [Pyrinomonadaceae bacterium]|nr:protein kinase [Pyrinomonadaceae bacterium]
MLEQSIGHYKLISLLGSGGMGEVYLATDTKLGRRVAIKVLSPELISDERANKRLIKEARAAATLDHANICAIHEVGEDDGRGFIVMQFLDGETLQQRLKSDRLSIDESLRIATQVAEAIADAHSHGIIHRDIKPGNVMITTRGTAKVMDFGLAKQMRPDAGTVGEAETEMLLSTPGAVMGTLPYMSPEQVRGESLDERSDIFSFGVLLYEMLTGKQPFAQKSSAATASAILTHEPPRWMPDSGNNVTARELLLHHVVFKCLEKDREHRYQTMKDVLQDFANASHEGNASSYSELTQRLPATVATSANRQAASHRLRIPAVILAAALVIAAAAYFLHNRVSSNPARPRINSLAVLPLKAFDASDNLLGLGISDAVIRKISQTGQLVVRPTSAVRRYLNEETDGLTAARQLNVDAVLEGTVQRNSGRLRVSVNLMQTSDGISLWSDHFDMDQSDIFEIQDTMAQRVATSLQLKLDQAQQSLLSKRQTSNPTAYESYVKGVYSFSQRGYGAPAKPQMDETLALFKKALEADPDYALAHAQLAYAYAWMALFVEPRQPRWAELVQEEIDRAQRLDSQLAETHIPRFMILWSGYGGWKIEAAIRELRSAQVLNPNVGHMELGVLYQHSGLEDLASQEFERAMAIDPTDNNMKAGIVSMYWIVRDYDGELAASKRLFNDSTVSIWSLMAKGRLEEAQKGIDRSEQAGGDRFLPNKKALLYALKGDFHAAENQIPIILGAVPAKDPEYHHNTYDVACIYALEGKSEDAVKWLNETAGTGFPSYPLFERDAYLNRIRQSPEFVEFMKRMKELNEKLRSQIQQ